MSVVDLVRNKLSNKIKSKQGASLAETLMTVLIMSIVLLAMTSGAGAVQRSYRKIVLKANAINLMSTLSTAINADLKYATDINTDDDGNVISFYSKKRNIVMWFEAKEDGETGQTFLYIKYVDKQNPSNDPEVLAVSKSIYTDDMDVVIEEPLQYHLDSDDGEEGYFSYKIAVYKKNREEGDKELIAQNYIVRPCVYSV